MAFGKSQQTNVYYAKLKGLKKGTDESLHFSVVKSDDKENPIEASYIAGYFESIAQDSYEYEGEEKKGFKLTLRDGDQTIIWSTGMTGVSRSFLNSLLSVEGGVQQLSLEVYVNRDGYNSIAVKHNGESIGWKHDYEWQKSRIDTQVSKSGKKTNDYYELDVALWDMIPSIAKSEDNDLNNVVSEPVVQEVEAPVVSEEDEMPF